MYLADISKGDHHMARFQTVAKFVGALVNVVVTDTQPQFKSDRTVYSYTQVDNAGSRHFMLDGGGWTFLSHGSEMADAVIEAARPLLAQNRVVDNRTQTLASLRQMIQRQIAYIRKAAGPQQHAHCSKVLNEYLVRRGRIMAA
jgi:hypothetical protein